MVLLISQVDNASVIVEKLAAISRYLFGNAVWIFDVPLAELLEYAAETVVPPLLFFRRLAWVCCSELEKQLVTYTKI